jgi:hypothetical protein
MKKSIFWSMFFAIALVHVGGAAALGPIGTTDDQWGVECLENGVISGGGSSSSPNSSGGYSGCGWAVTIYSLNANTFINANVTDVTWIAHQTTCLRATMQVRLKANDGSYDMTRTAVGQWVNGACRPPSVYWPATQLKSGRNYDVYAMATGYSVTTLVPVTVSTSSNTPTPIPGRGIGTSGGTCTKTVNSPCTGMPTGNPCLSGTTTFTGQWTCQSGQDVCEVRAGRDYCPKGGFNGRCGGEWGNMCNNDYQCGPGTVCNTSVGFGYCDSIEPASCSHLNGYCWLPKNDPNGAPPPGGAPHDICAP